MKKQKLKFLASSSRRKGFTLAELLTVIGVIGIVAEITIPVLMNNIQDQTFKVELKKFYSTLDQVQLTINQDDNGFVTPMDSNADTPNVKLLAKYISFSKICPYGGGKTAASQGCWYYDVKANPPHGGSDGDCGSNPLQCYAGENIYVASGIMKNGTLIAINDTRIYVDVNGFAKPNTPGRDVYAFTYDATKKRFIPMNWGSAKAIDVMVN